MPHGPHWSILCVAEGHPPTTGCKLRQCLQQARGSSVGRHSSTIQVRLSQWCSSYIYDIRDRLYSALSHHLQDQAPPLVSVSTHSPVTHWRWHGDHPEIQEACPTTDITSHTPTWQPTLWNISIPTTLIFLCYSSTLAPDTLWGWRPSMPLEAENLPRITGDALIRDVSLTI